MKKIKNLLLITLLIASISFSLGQLAFADEGAISGAKSELINNDKAFIESVGLGTDISIGKIISQLIKLFLSFLGVIFVVLIIYAGFTWMTAAGNDEKINTAKKTLTAAIIGLAIVLSAYALTYFVIDRLLVATRGGAGLPN